MPSSFTMTAEHGVLSDVLRDLWRDYVALKSEMDNFVPKPLEDFEGKYLALRDRLISLNPNAPTDSLEDFARQSVAVEHEHQFTERFNARVLKLLVSVIFMSQALCEALINQILILRFHDEGISELYIVWERAKFIDKWLLAPKSFLPSYNFDKGGEIYQSLKELVELRNIYTHYKPKIEIEGKTIYGKEPKRKTFSDLMNSISRFISLPYDLALLSSILMKDSSYQTFLHREEVPAAESHKRELERIMKA